jgi:hypothetical protein
MSFRLMNAPSTFMRLMNQILESFINKFVVICFNDILVFSHNETYHNEHLKSVLEVLLISYWALKECSGGVAYKQVVCKSEEV